MLLSVDATGKSLGGAKKPAPAAVKIAAMTK
jgi:hypothetical protein